MSGILRRLTGSVLVLLLASLAVFSLVELTPGGAEQALLGPAALSDEQAVEAVRQEHRLDEPLTTRFGLWLRDAAHLDFGESVRSGQDVSALIAERLGPTLQLSLYALALVLMVGLPLGVLSAVKRGSWLDRAVSTGAVLSASVPPFALGVLLVGLLSVNAGWFPSVGAGTGGWDRWHHLTLPAVTLAAMQLAIIVRQTRAAALDVVQRDYVTFARARGLSGRRIFGAYLVRNSAVSVVTVTGLLLALSLSGAVLVETVFAIPGVGSLVIDSVTARDVPVLQGITLIVAAFVVLINVAVDIAVFILDPRTRKATVAT